MERCHQTYHTKVTSLVHEQVQVNVMSERSLKICVVGSAGSGKTVTASLVARILESHGIAVDFVDQDFINVMDDDRIMKGIEFLKNEYKDGLVVESIQAARRSAPQRKR